MPSLKTDRERFSRQPVFPIEGEQMMFPWYALRKYPGVFTEEHLRWFQIHDFPIDALVIRGGELPVFDSIQIYESKGQPGKFEASGTGRAKKIVLPAPYTSEDVVAITHKKDGQIEVQFQLQTKIEYMRYTIGLCPGGEQLPLPGFELEEAGKKDRDLFGHCGRCFEDADGNPG